MNKITMLLLFSITTNAYALPECPKDLSKIWDKCFSTFTTASGNQYVGEWKDGKKHGQGTFTRADGSQWAGEEYIGEWKDDKPNGQGTYTYADGEQYVGEWKDGKPNGQGTYTHTNGDKYVGEFKDDKIHGQGTYTFTDGKQWVGYYLNGKYIPKTCEAMGLVEGSSEFGQCVITLINKLQ